MKYFKICLRSLFEFKRIRNLENMLVKMKHFPKFQDFKQPRKDDRASQPKGANLQLNRTNSKINVKYENTKTDLCIPISLQVSRSVS